MSNADYTALRTCSSVLKGAVSCLNDELKQLVDQYDFEIPIDDDTVDPSWYLFTALDKKKSSSTNEISMFDAAFSSRALQGFIRKIGMDGDVSAQVEGLVQQATNEENLARMYEGWMSWV